MKDSEKTINAQSAEVNKVEVPRSVSPVAKTETQNSKSEVAQKVVSPKEDLVDKTIQKVENPETGKMVYRTHDEYLKATGVDKGY